jgi:pyrimidine-nucleoside phosphorylase/thymidine phosphorylase
MTRIGRELGKRVRALITAMDEPLGRAVGNALEVAECVECLRGGGPTDLVELSLELAAETLVAAGVAADREAALGRCRRAITDGSALERFRRVVAAQGGDPRVCDEPERVLPRAARSEVFRAASAGFVTRLRAWPVGQASMLLGAGRRTVNDGIDPAAGILLHRKVGERVAAGDAIAELRFNESHAAAVPAALALLADAVAVGAEPPPALPLVLERL